MKISKNEHVFLTAVKRRKGRGVNSISHVGDENCLHCRDSINKGIASFGFIDFSKIKKHQFLKHQDFNKIVFNSQKTLKFKQCGHQNLTDFL